MTIRVVAAFLASGRRKAGTALLIASTPVSATAPEEKARMSTNRVIPGSTAAPSVNSASASSSGARAPRFPK
jgi:hypothetical protein